MAAGNMQVKSLRHGRVAWDHAETTALGQAFVDALPGMSKHLPLQDKFSGGLLLPSLPEGNVTVKEVKTHSAWLRPVLQLYQVRLNIEKII